MFDIRLREVPEQLLVTEQRNVAQAELSDWLHEAMGRVHQLAREHGGGVDTHDLPYLLRADRAAEPVLVVIYHGNPNEGPVPVEVGRPIDPTEVAVTVPTRPEPAHREAYVRLRKEQVPGVNAAFSAVEQWVHANGWEIVDAPREVYWADFPSAAPDDDVFDVAFPIR